MFGQTQPNPLDDLLNQPEENPLDALLGTPTASSAAPTPKKKASLFDRGVSAAVASGGDIASNIFAGLGKVAEVGKERSWFSDVSDRFKATANKHRTAMAEDPANTFGEKAATFAGSLVPQVAVGGALAKSIFNPITSKLAATRFGAAADRISKLASSNRTVQKGVAAGLTSAPAEILGGYATTALTNPEDLDSALPIVGAGISVGINSLMGARAATQAAKQAKLASLTPDAVEVDPNLPAFTEAVKGARKTAQQAHELFNTYFVGTKKNPVSPGFEVPKEIKSTFGDMKKILKSLENDGPTIKNLSLLDATQRKLIELMEGMYAVNSGQINEVAFENLVKSMSQVEGIKLPEFTWASPTPTVSAMQRLQDNVEIEGPLRMDPNAKLGTVESLIAGERPKVPSMYEAPRKYFEKMHQQYVNYKGALKMFGTGKATDPYEMALQLSGNNGRVRQFLEIQPKLLNAQTGVWEDAMIEGKRVMAMPEILRMAGTDDASLATLNGYLVAKQLAAGADDSLRASAKLQIPGFNPEWAQSEVSRIMRESPDIAKAGEEFFRHTKFMAEYMRPLVGDDVVEAWMKMNYAPASRALQKSGDAFGFTMGRGQGSSDLVFNPMVKYFENAQVAIAATEKTKMWQRLYDVIDANPEKYAASATIDRANEKVIQKNLDAIREANPDMNETVARKIANLMAGTSIDKTAKTVTFLKDGGFKTIKMGDDFIELFEGFEGPAELGYFGQGLQKVEALPRTLFSIVNDMTLMGPMRDMAEVFVNDPNVKATPKGMVNMFLDTIKGLKEVNSEGPLYQRILAAGGGIGGRYVGPTGGFASHSFEEMKRIADKEMPSVLRKLEGWSASLSQASRMGAAMRVLADGGSDAEAAKMFRAVIADPQQIGSKMQSAARITAFMNMGIQSADKFARQIKTNPELTAIKGFAGIGIPAAILWWYGKDDPEIQQLRGSKGGENYFYLRMTEDSPVTRIPKPYIFGQMFGTSVETVLDKAFGDNPQAVEQLIDGMRGQLAVNIIPLSLQTLANTVLGSKYLGIGEGLIPAGGATNNQMAGDQRFQNTTTIARKLGDLTGIPASGWDDVMRTFLTNEPYKALALGDRMLTNRTAPTREDVPIIGKMFPTTNKSNVASVNRFYDLANKYADRLASLKDAERKGDVERLDKLVNSNLPELEQAMVFAEGLKDVQEIRAAINMTNENKMMSPQERKEIIRELNKAIQDYTTMFLDAWDEKQKEKK